MKATLLRTGSIPAHSPIVSGSPRVSLSRQDSITGVFSGERQAASSPRIILNLESSHRRSNGIRRALSESDIFRSDFDIFSGFSKLNKTGSRSFPSLIPEEEVGADLENYNDRRDSIGTWPSSSFPVEFSGEGYGKGRDDRRNDDDNSKIGDHYRELLKSNPTDPLLLRNYGKYLHEVEQDTDKAEEYYGRAILASPGDGEVLSLYGNLIWSAHRDEERAKTYFDQAVYASPNDCMVLGSYAHFMWEAEEDEEDEAIQIKEKSEDLEMSPAMVAAF